MSTDATEPDADNSPAARPQASGVENADVELGKKLASERDSPVVKAAAWAGEIGDQGPLYLLCAALFVAGLAARERRLAGSGISMLVAIGAADLSKRLVKSFVRRSRPHVLLDEGDYKADTGGSEEKQEQSFPSGHTAGSGAAARALSRNFPAAGAAAGAAAVAIGISRVAKGAHWPLDVAAGAVIGLGAEALSAMLLQFGWRSYCERARQTRRRN